jgi:ketosteroid isomerase-like protein
MKTLKRLTVLCLSLVLTTAMAYMDDKSAIANVTSDLGKAFNKGQTSELVKLYADNAVFMPPSSEILTGQGAIKKYWDGLRKAGFNEFTIRDISLNAVGNTAYQTALWEAVRKDSAGNIIKLDGNISSVMERQKDGSWKIKLQSWN